MFVFKVNSSKYIAITFIWALFSTFVTCNLLCWLYILLIILTGDVELNPGPKGKAAQTLAVCHWNLNSICAHNFTKLSLLRAYLSAHKFDIICLSETYLDSSIDDPSLEISGYYLLSSDHPSNKKCGGICIYYKDFLPLKVTGVRLLEECIFFDLIISNKICSFVALYRSPSQSPDDFATFSHNFEMTLDLVSKKNPFLIVVLGDFSAKLSQWHDKDSSTSEGISIENITSQFGLHQIINEPTHILEDSSSCIDLIFIRNLIYQLSQLSPQSTLTVTIRLYTPNSILKSFIHHLTLGRFGTIKIQMLILSDDPLMNLTGIELLRINM